LRGAARDLRSGSGLTANRKNLLNASELYLAFDGASRSSRPALCYRPLLAFPHHFAMLRVTSLEPRTPHQPEKLKKLSKNDLVVLLLLSESMKRWRVYLIYFQSSAASPQPGDRILCSEKKKFAQSAVAARYFGTSRTQGLEVEILCPHSPDCETPAKSLLVKGSTEPDGVGSSAAAAPETACALANISCQGLIP
jgi:hypothetical protein